MRKLFISAFAALVALATPAIAYSPMRVTAYASTANIEFADVGFNTLITNTGSSGAVVLTLPKCTSGTSYGNPAYQPKLPSTIGMKVSVLLTAANDVDLNPNDTTDTITGVGIAGSGGDAISSAGAIGDYIELTCTATTKWTMGNISGTWTDVN